MVDHECDDAVEKLYEYLDGELDGPTMQQVKDHLQRCSPCLEAFDFHDQLRHVVQHKCAEQMPLEMKAKLLHLIDETEPTSPPA